MKRLFLVFLCVIFCSLANGQTKTSVLELPLFESHTILESGSKSSTVPAQTLNNLPVRLEYWLSYYFPSLGD